ncbi:MAG: hypothetical protein NXH97_16255 [Rhodobacteraceae bacterium]|nr:hypothetical protein [Paracoccaceae bacterium]
MIAHAKIKTGAIDAAVLAKLYATGFPPKVWIPDALTLLLRRQAARRIQRVRQRVRLDRSRPSTSGSRHARASILRRSRPHENWR